MSDGHPHQLIFFFNDTATTEIYTLSLHDALPICRYAERVAGIGCRYREVRDGVFDARDLIRTDGGNASKAAEWDRQPIPDRKSTRLNSSHQITSYAVFCFKKKHRSPL